MMMLMKIEEHIDYVEQKEEGIGKKKKSPFKPGRL